MPYLNVEEVESALIVATMPPFDQFNRLIALPNQTWEKRTCHALRMGSASGTERPGVSFIGGVHAREWGSADILVNFIEQLGKAYARKTGIKLGRKHFEASDVAAIVEGLDLFVFPQVNPDGRQHSFTVDAMWRKNRRPAAGRHTGEDCIGVDLNRNYDFLWDFRTYFSPDANVQNSTDPCDPQIYVGPSAESEPETRNVVWLMDTFPQIRYFVDLHSFSQDILCSWGDDENQSSDPRMTFQNRSFDRVRGISGDSADVGYREYVTPTDQAEILRLAAGLADGIRAVRGRSYTVEQAYHLYPTAGSSTDYAFSRHAIDPGKPSVMAYAIEWGPDNPAWTLPQKFHPPYPQMRRIIAEVTSGLIQFCLAIIQPKA
jgi:murein tripeptide amidase MpaA